VSNHHQLHEDKPMQRRDLSKILLGSAVAGGALVSRAQAACTAPCFPLAATESAASIVDYQYPPGDVRRYGATGNGITNDQPAIQAAIDAAPGGGEVYIPSSGSTSYRLNSGLKITRPIRLLGAGPGQTTLCGTGLSSGAIVLDVDGTVNPNLELVDVQGLTLMSDNNSPDLLRVNRASNSAFRDIGLRNGRYGLVVTGNRTFSNQYERILCINSTINTAVRFASYTGGGHHTFIGCGFMGGYGLIVQSDSTVTGISLHSCNFEASTFEAIYCNGTVQGLNISGCRFEKANTTGSDILIDPAIGKLASGISIQGCYFETDSAQYAVQFGGSGSAIRGFNVSSNLAQDYSAGLVRLNGDGESGAIVGNRLENVPAVVNTIRPGVLVTNNENQTGKLGPSWQPPLVTPIYTVANVVTDRSYDAGATSTAELARVLGTLIADLRAAGLVK
jgi:hypothetical protein